MNRQRPLARRNWRPQRAPSSIHPSTCWRGENVRRLGIISSVTVAGLLIICGLGRLGRVTSTAAAQNTQPGPSSAVPSSTPNPPAAPVGTVAYVAQRGESIPLIARHFLSKTSYLTSAELAEAVR